MHSHVPILSQINSIYALPSNLFKTQLILFSSPLLGSPSCLFPSGFFTKSLTAFIFAPHVPFVQAITCSFCIHTNNIWWGVQIMNLCSMKFSPVPYYFLSPRPKHLHQRPVLEHIQLLFVPYSERQRFTLLQNYMNITIPSVLVFMFLVHIPQEIHLLHKIVS